MDALKNTVKAIVDAGCKSQVKMVGGAPITQSFADNIGADAYTPDAGAENSMHWKMQDFRPVR